jgi:hypothetical protein
MSKDKTLSEQGLRSLAEAYHNRWPKCVQFMLYLADLDMGSGATDQAVLLLHKAVSSDITGQVAIRLWGMDHPYKTLWPTSIEISDLGINTPQNIPVPASVAALLGWNQLPDSTKEKLSFDYSDTRLEKTPNSSNDPSKEHRDSPDESKIIGCPGEKKHEDFIKEALDDLKKLASKIKQPDLVKMDGRFPVYVILTTKTGLEQKYGLENSNNIINELQLLVSNLRGSRISQRTWSSILFCPDDPENIKYFGIKPVPHNDPWGIKLSIADLELFLEKRGEMIGALLIIGGHEVVPFHHLPNPVDDDDADVPSDNPYATGDENYFVQQWPIGRLPGSAGKDPGFLWKSIQAINKHYQKLKNSQPWYQRLWNRILNLLWPPYRKIQPSLGYTAAVWRRASLSVFRTIGQPRSLLVSPPTISCDPADSVDNYKDGLYLSSCISLNPSILAYFNLHGLQDTPEWYGQSDPTEIDNNPDFPIALRPEDIVNGGRAPKVVFSEACYGAHIKGKRLEEALALKFLASGSRCVIGSSCISYGSIRTPLIGADLLGHAFWKYLVEGMSVGEALRRAKIHLVDEMTKRQGYLDGEDQKTLISFILYGDPLTQAYGESNKSKLLIRSVADQEAVKTVCARTDNSIESHPVSEEIMSNVKHVVSDYLPGMRDANISVGVERTGCKNACRNCLSGNLCPTTQFGNQKGIGKISDYKVITLSKSIPQANFNHKQFAHITLDKQGKVIKLAVSR